MPQRQATGLTTRDLVPTGFVFLSPAFRGSHPHVRFSPNSARCIFRYFSCAAIWIDLRYISPSGKIAMIPLHGDICGLRSEHDLPECRTLRVLTTVLAHALLVRCLPSILSAMRAHVRRVFLLQHSVRTRGEVDSRLKVLSWGPRRLLYQERFLGGLGQVLWFRCLVPPSPLAGLRLRALWSSVNLRETTTESSLFQCGCTPCMCPRPTSICPPSG